MTTDTTYEERRSDWLHQVSAVGTTQWLQCADPSSVRRVWLARLQFEMVMWMYGYESLTTPWQALCVDGKEGYTLTE